ncbi:helix-turn-helix domain-containing protein [Dyadobacter bucti]|uniref:helix-turn-helix domain-containing protein n=1 Tax=Dyadobacter bucti TaxID=2572203 RepID=UPI0011082C19|nr:helix-turn-helix transcriptional regulator [Dyadobacter bucti]
MFDIRRVKTIREYLQLSENQFAKKIGVAQTTYNRIEKGNASLTAEAASEIVKIFEVDPNWLLLGTGGDEPIFSKQIDQSNTITITKDEYIDLQRKALSGNEDRLAALEKKIDELKGK